MIAPAIAAACGLGEQAGQLVEETVLNWFADRRALLVVDNCEHLVEGVAAFVERLLTRCPGVSVLATSRTRLLLPFERPFPVPGLSLGAAAGDGRAAAGAGGGEPGDGDAVALLTARAAAVGVPVTRVDDRRRAAAICRALDGMALAIELAASRLPALGLDGLEAGLGDRLRVLTGGGRADERHRSLRATLDWSYDLAEPVDRTVLRRVSVFASAFTARAAAEVVALGAGDGPEGPDGTAAGTTGTGAGRGPAPGLDTVADSLARLADQSLLVVVRSGGETRYRALETVRQYAGERAGDRERDAARSRHLAWCLASADALRPAGPIDGGWRAAFDDVADDLRSARAWAAARPEHRDDALRLSEALAALAWHRGRGVEAQHRYEEAAALAPDERTRAALLHDAAHAAANRHAGDDAVDLHRRAAEASIAAGDDAHAARNLALAATLISRCPGIMTEEHPAGEVRGLLDRAAALAVGHPEVDAALLVAMAFDGVERDDLDVALAERAVELARRQGDAVTESAALDHVSAVALSRGDVAGAAATAALRTELLARLPYSPAAAYEIPDAYHMACECALGAGDVPAALRFARRLGDLPSHRDLPHLGHNKLLIVHALTGTWDEVPALAERFHEGWVAAGRPMISNLSRGARSVSLVHALRGDEDERRRWLAIAGPLQCRRKKGLGEPSSFEAMLDAIVHLHRGEHDAALAALPTPPEAFRRWHTGMSRPWYAAAWAEAGVLAGAPGVAARLSRARFVTAGNPVAGPLVERAAALAEGRRDDLPALADALDRAGCPYQAARTRVLAGGEHGARGRAALAAMGATPMPVG
jgi:predicted ATPase